MAIPHCRTCGESLPAEGAPCPRCARGAADGAALPRADGRDRIVGTLLFLAAASLLALGLVAGVIRPRLAPGSASPAAVTPPPGGGR